MPKRSPYRRRHSPEFKVECVRVMRERLATGLTLQRVSEEVEVGPDLLREWAKQVAGAPPTGSRWRLTCSGARSIPA
jgi:transposase-like protein